MQNTSNMPTLQIRNVPDELYNDLIRSAEESRRSITQEAIVLLELALESKEMEKTRLKNKILQEIILSGKSHGVSSRQAIEWIREDRDQ